MKKTLSLLLALSFLLLSLCACNKTENATSTTEASRETTSTTDSTQNTTEGTIATVATEATTEPSVTQPPATEPPATEPPATQPPTTEPTATQPPTTEPPATEPPLIGYSNGLCFEKQGESYCVSIGNIDELPTHLIIPDTFYNLPVTKIKDETYNGESFGFCDKLISVTFSNNIKVIGARAFTDCQNLAKVTFGSRLESIGEQAFYGCAKLSEITIPGNVRSIGTLAFCQCKNLSSVTLQHGIKTIEYGAFEETAISSITIPDSVTEMEALVFNNCRNLKNVNWGKGMSIIPLGTFGACESLTSISIPDFITDIGESAFDTCKNLHSITIPKSVKNIGQTAFQCCPLLSTINYKGSMSDWKAITKGLLWCYDVSAQQIICADGNLNLDGTPITPPATEPSATQLPATEPPATEPPTTEPALDVLIISDTRTISDQTINADVYITSTGVATFNNVSVSGNIYCHGQLQASGCTANNVYAYAYGSMMSCGAFDGTYGKISGSISCNNITILDNALDYAFTKWGKIEPPATKPPATEPPATAPASDVLIISDTRTISNQTIDTDVYITSTGVATFNNVSVSGNIYCHGQLQASGCTANNVYAYAYGSMMSCGAFDGTHGKVSGGIDCTNMTIRDDALDYAFSTWGK